MNCGIFTFSLDFELGWGNLAWSQGAYRRNLFGVRTLIPQLLDLSAEYGIHLTWATIGLLFYENRDDARHDLSTKSIANRLPKWKYLDSPKEIDERLFFAADLIRRIVSYDGQEMASHTFSHIICKSDDASEIELFKGDLTLAMDVASRFGISPQSIVFPQNRWTEKHLLAVKEAGFRCYRGNPIAWGKNSHDASRLNCLRRGFRWIDAIVGLTGHRHFSVADIGPTVPVNVAATRFLNPLSPSTKRLGDLRTSRILEGMTAAAQHAEVYHLWCHPHNLGRDVELQTALLRRIFEHFRYLRDNHGMRSLNMIEVAEHSRVSNGQAPSAVEAGTGSQLSVRGA